MTVTDGARQERVGRWRVWSVTPAAEWVEAVDRLVAAGGSLHRSKHADTYRWTRAGGDVYVKVYRRYRRWTALKDWFRPSKAENVRRMSAALTAKGFLVPHVLAVGEEHVGLGVRRSWCASAALGGEPIAARLAALAAATDRTTLRAKRGVLETLGREVARLHRAGVVAGDLVPANVWIAIAAADLQIAFLDHDRTRVGGTPAPWRRARRNLVQLNRIVLPGVGATDRLRVYRAYAAEQAWSHAEAYWRLPWIVRKTIARRRAERGHTPAIPRHADFRTVMRAAGPYARSAAEEQP
jgi:tRNA A-37 threonylcarbamoyl transferase component Bud32